VIDAGDSDFDDAVLVRSGDVPVLVDFWAPWCGPCRTLGPVLERIAAAAAGRFELVKVNVDESPEVTARYGIQGIPAVKLYRDGEVIGEFVGALPERHVNAFLDQHLPTEAMREAQQASVRLAAGDAAGARAAAEAALAAAGGAAGPAAWTAHAVLARLDLAAGDTSGAAAHAAAVASAAPEWDAAQAVIEAAELGREARAAGDRAAIEARIAVAPPGDMADGFALAIHLLLGGDHRGALEQLIGLVERDRRWRDEAARRAILTVFQLIGSRSPLADEYRRRLTILL
jgi:putative thioredoxin